VYEKPVVYEYWRNRCWGLMNRRVLRLQVGSSDMGSEIWQVHVEWHGFESDFDFRDEQDARTELALLLQEHGPWGRLPSCEDVHSTGYVR
jgi:hypothetical protein